MTTHLLLALVPFAFVTSITPGPNNVMLLTSGINFGVRRSVPHILGVNIGFTVMVFAVGLGLGQVFAAFPVAYTVLRVLGAAYLLWLAWHIATEKGVGDTVTERRPMTFLGAAGFQWVNPKTWVMAVGAIATYAGPHPSIVMIAAVAVVYGLVNGPSIAAWCVFGQSMRRFLSSPRHLRIFNITMAALLVLSLYPLITE